LIYEAIDPDIPKLDVTETSGAKWDFSGHPWVDADVANILTLDEEILSPLAAAPTTPALRKVYRADGITWDPGTLGINKSYKVQMGATGDELFDDAENQNFTSGGGDWDDGAAGAAMGTYGETTDLTLTADGVGDYAVLLEAEAPMTTDSWYVLEVDVANITATWTITDFDGAFEIGTITANGTNQRFLFKYEDPSGGGLRLVAVLATSDGNFDNFSLKEATWVAGLDEDGVLHMSSVSAAMEVNTDPNDITLTASQMNAIMVITGAGEVTILDGECDSATGKWITVKQTGAYAVDISFSGSDVGYLVDGTLVDGTDEIQTAGAAGNQITLVCLITNQWWVTGEIGTSTEEAAD
jgi:hypothetical protein